MNKCLAWNVDLSSLGVEVTEEDEKKLSEGEKLDQWEIELEGAVWWIGRVMERVCLRWLGTVTGRKGRRLSGWRMSMDCGARALLVLCDHVLSLKPDA